MPIRLVPIRFIVSTDHDFRCGGTVALCRISNTCGCLDSSELKEWDDPVGLRIGLYARTKLHYLRVQGVTLVARNLLCFNVIRLDADIDVRRGIGTKIVHPRRIAGSSTLGADNENPVANGEVFQWSLTELARFGARHRQEHDIGVRERTTDSSAVGPKLLDDCSIEGP